MKTVFLLTLIVALFALVLAAPANDETVLGDINPTETKTPGQTEGFHLLLLKKLLFFG